VKDASLFYLVAWIAVWIVIAVPLAKLGRKAGHATWVGWVVSFPLLPFLALGYLYVLAFRKD
jgi:hypothetical protein